LAHTGSGIDIAQRNNIDAPARKQSLGGIQNFVVGFFHRLVDLFDKQIRIARDPRPPANS
jgi:hypothetical protein